MFLKFTVSNYKSFKDNQIIDCFAVSTKEKQDTNIFEGKFKNKSIKLTRTGLIMGPNASGKSNFIEAVDLMDSLVRNSANQANDNQTKSYNWYTPFQLDPEARDKPSEFEMVFTHNGISFQYGFALDSKGIVDEWLYAYPKGSLQKWMYRVTQSDGKADIRFSRELGMPLRRQKTLAESTKRSALALSVANLLNMDEFKIPFDWFQNVLVVVSNRPNEDGRFPESFSNYSQAQCIDKVKIREHILRLLKSADVGIDDIVVEKRRFTKEQLIEMKEFITTPQNVDIDDLVDTEFARVSFQHKNLETGETVLFNRDQESTGTMDLFALAGPLCDIMIKGRVVFIDEFGSALHPNIIALLINVFHSNEANPNNAQLIFTTHAYSLLMKDIFRRDQIWLTQKHSDQSTSITPLSDYHPREKEAILKGYFNGRYRGIPVTDDFNVFINESE